MGLSRLVHVHASQTNVAGSVGSIKMQHRPYPKQSCVAVCNYRKLGISSKDITTTPNMSCLPEQLTLPFRYKDVLTAVYQQVGRVF